MTLNRIPEDMRKDILNLQQYYKLTERMKNNDKFYYWESRKRSNLYFKVFGFIEHINNSLDPKEIDIFYMRYILKYPIMKVVQHTGYSKRMIQYKLNGIIIKLEEGPVIYYAIKKLKLQQQFIKEYSAHKNKKGAPDTPKKVQ